MVAALLQRSLERLMASLKAAGSHRRSPLRLMDVLEIRESMEEVGRFDVRLLESSPRPVYPRHVVARASISVAGIDSSSRRIEAGAADVVVASVAAHDLFSRRHAEWPPLAADFSPKNPRPFIYVLPNGAIEEQEDPLITFRNVLGERFTAEYEIEVAEDEARRSLEDWMMMEFFSDCDCAVLIDGPIYFVPRALGSKDRRGAVSMTLIRSRLTAIEALESRGVPVIGVVKRVERSSILSVAFDGSPSETDVSLITRSLRSQRAEPGRIYVSPPLSLTYPEISPSKRIRYVVVPPGKYQTSSRASSYQIYRLETTERSAKLLERMHLDAVDVFLRDSLLSGSTEPLSIKASDERARMVAEAVAAELRRALSLHGEYLSYETRREAAWS